MGDMQDVFRKRLDETGISQLIFFSNGISRIFTLKYKEDIQIVPPRKMARKQCMLETEVCGRNIC